MVENIRVEPSIPHLLLDVPFFDAHTVPNFEVSSVRWVSPRSYPAVWDVSLRFLACSGGSSLRTFPRLLALPTLGRNSSSFNEVRSETLVLRTERRLFLLNPLLPSRELS